MPEKILQSELYQLFARVIFPAFIAVGIKIAIEMKKSNTRLSLCNVLLSMTIGMGGAYISSDVVQKTVDGNWVSVSIALIAITSEKIGAFLIYKLDVDVFLTALFNGLFEFISNLFKSRIK